MLLVVYVCVVVNLALSMAFCSHCDERAACMACYVDRYTTASWRTHCIFAEHERYASALGAFVGSIQLIWRYYLYLTHTAHPTQDMQATADRLGPPGGAGMRTNTLQNPVTCALTCCACTTPTL